MSTSPLTVTAPQLRPPFRYIAIEGPIGVGKTSLARRLAERWSMQPVFERPQDNPFLERFYRDTGRYALAAQLHFALQRAQQAQEVAAAYAAGTALIGDRLRARRGRSCARAARPPATARRWAPVVAPKDAAAAPLAADPGPSRR